MTHSVRHGPMAVLAEVLRTRDWDRLTEVFHEDGTLEFPQSGEVFRGIANIRAQFAEYPELDPGSSEISEVIDGTLYALSPTYTVIAVEGTGNRGTAIIRIRYPDDSLWWGINVYELADGRIKRARTYFAPDFEAPEWRAPYREAP